jgi:hypothetical protein
MNDRWRGLFLGEKNFWLRSGFDLEEQVGVRKLVLFGYLWECKV